MFSIEFEGHDNSVMHFYRSNYYVHLTKEKNIVEGVAKQKRSSWRFLRKGNSIALDKKLIEKPVEMTHNCK